MNPSKKLVEIAVDPKTDGVRTCPKALEPERGADDGPVFVQAAEVEDPELLAQSHPGSGEKLVALPRSVAVQLARHLLREDLS